MKSSWPIWVLLVVVLVATNPTAADLTQKLVYEQLTEQVATTEDLFVQALGALGLRGTGVAALAGVLSTAGQAATVENSVAISVCRGACSNYYVCCVRSVQVGDEMRIYVGALGRYMRLRWLEAR